MPREKGKRGSLFSFTTLVIGVVYFLWKNSNEARDKKAKKHSAAWRAHEEKRAKQGKKKPEREPRKFSDFLISIYANYCPERGPDFILTAEI